MSSYFKSTPTKKPQKPNPTTTFGTNNYGGVDFKKSVPNSKVVSKSSKPILRPPGEFSNAKVGAKPPLSPSAKANTPAGRTDSTYNKKVNSPENGKENIQPISRTVSKTSTTHSKTLNNGITPDISHPGRHSSNPITPVPKATITATATATATITATATGPAVGGARDGSWAGKLHPGRGLKNLGNTCFMNCILQCLSHTLPLREYFVSDSYKQSLRSPKRGSLSAAFAKVLGELWMSYTTSVAPYDLKNEVSRVAPRFSGYSQHDAQEFMRFLLNEVHEEINRADVKGRRAPEDKETLKDACERYLTWENSRVSELFCGMLRSTIYCTVCKKKSVVYDPYMDLALPIPKSTPTLVKRPSYISSYSLSYDSSAQAPVKLSQCFKQFTDEETLDDEERPYCSDCKKCTKCTKQLTVAKLPDILVIQLKRFSGYSVRSKLSTPVTFEQTWTLENESRVKHDYSLYGVVSHSGGIYGGHYKAFCKYKEQWRCFNDSYMSELGWDHVKTQEAYILFYELVKDVKDVSEI